MNAANQTCRHGYQRGLGCESCQSAQLLGMSNGSENDRLRDELSKACSERDRAKEAWADRDATVKVLVDTLEQVKSVLTGHSCPCNACAAVRRVDAALAKARGDA